MPRNESTGMTYEEAKKINPNVVRVVVCAACKYGDLIIPGARHWDPIMRALVDEIMPKDAEGRTQARIENRLSAMENQGFIDQWGNFMSRKEALEVAKANGQYGRYREPQNQEIMYSEDLY